MTYPNYTATDEAEALAVFFADVDEVRTVHYLQTFSSVCDDYVTGDCVAEHASNVDCQDCLEWMHA